MKVEPGPAGMLWVTLPYSAEGVAQIKKIPGHRWHPERKQWLLPDTPETRAVLAEFVANPPKTTGEAITVASKPGSAPPRRPRRPSEPGKPLTTNPPHPLIKAVDDELVLRGMAYGTRKSYGQHLRNYFDWLARTRLTPEQATREQIRAYLVEMASSGLVSAGYCRQARARH
jgi:hypothetical protein